MTGTGTTDGSGGTITRTTGDGIFLDTATNITLRNMTIGDGSATSDQPPDDSVFIGSDGIEMKDVLPGTGTAGLTLDNVKIVRTGDSRDPWDGRKRRLQIAEQRDLQRRRRHRGRRDVLRLRCQHADRNG